MLEETGLKVKELKLFKIYSGEKMYYKYPNGDEVFFVGVVFIGRHFYGEIKPDKIECDDIKFFSLDNLPVKINHPDQYIINDFLKKSYKK